LREGVAYLVLPGSSPTDVQELLITPASVQFELMRAAHTSRFAGHKGVSITLHRLRSKYWWPSMSLDVENFIRNCELCQQCKDPPRMMASKEPLGSMPVPDQPNFRVHADLFTVGRVSNRGNRYILVITDSFSKLTELVAIPDKTSETVARAIFDNWICRYSCPKQLLTDRGREFCNDLANKLYKLLGIDRLKTSAYHPQCNSSAESFNRELIKIMTVLLDNPDDEDWECYLPLVSLTYNTSVRRATKCSPFFLTYLQDPNLPTFDMENTRPLYGENWAVSAYQRMLAMHKLVRTRLEEAARTDARYYDRSHQHLAFEVGDRVFVKFQRSCFNVKNKKFARSWIPAVVEKVLSSTTYAVRKEGRPSTTANRMIVHRNRLKPHHVAQNDSDTVPDVQDTAQSVPVSSSSSSPPSAQPPPSSPSAPGASTSPTPRTRAGEEDDSESDSDSDDDGPTFDRFQLRPGGGARGGVPPVVGGGQGGGGGQGAHQEAQAPPPPPPQASPPPPRVAPLPPPAGGAPPQEAAAQGGGGLVREQEPAWRHRAGRAAEILFAPRRQLRSNSVAPDIPPTPAVPPENKRRRQPPR